MNVRNPEVGVKSPLDLGPKVWTFPEYAIAVAALAPGEQEKWLAAPVFLVVDRPENAAGPEADPAPPTVVTPRPTAATPLAGGAAKPSWLVPLVASKLNASPERLTVGRSTVCDVVLPMGAVSKVHAYLHDVLPGAATIEDAGSTNGTFAAGVRLDAGKRHLLRDGSRVMLGDVTVEFRAATKFRLDVQLLGKTLLGR